MQKFLPQGYTLRIYGLVAAYCLLMACAASGAQDKIESPSVHQETIFASENTAIPVLAIPSNLEIFWKSPCLLEIKRDETLVFEELALVTYSVTLTPPSKRSVSVDISYHTKHQGRYMVSIYDSDDDGKAESVTGVTDYHRGQLGTEAIFAKADTLLAHLRTELAVEAILKRGPVYQDPFLQAPLE